MKFGDEEIESQVREKCEESIRVGNVKNRMQDSLMTAVGTCGGRERDEIGKNGKGQQVSALKLIWKALESH